MTNTQTDQAFYSLTLQAASSPTAACLCNVIPGAKTSDSQILEARGERLYLRRLVSTNDSDVKIETVLEHNTFSTVRAVGALRVAGSEKDLIAVTSDSGKIAMLKYNAARNRLEPVSLETFGKSGIRRTVPGQYLSVDPRGRCLMISSVEKNKIVYFYQRQSDGTINVSSPHEANQNGLICFETCALDTGWENPIYAALEVDYTQAEADPHSVHDKHLNYYTVDLGLNHVSKSWSTLCDPTANKLFSVPGGQEGPSGVIICALGRIYYMHIGMRAPLSIPIPQRQGALEQPRDRRIVSGCTFAHKSKPFFLLVQTNDGDVFKLNMDMELDDHDRPTDKPKCLNLRYFETLPVARELLLIRKGYLYVVAESGPSVAYFVNSLAEDSTFEPWNIFTSSAFADHEEELETLTFQPREELSNISHAAEMPGLHPLIRADVDNLTNEVMPQIYAIQGKSNTSVFKTTRWGMSVEDLVAHNLGEALYDRIWSMKRQMDDRYHYFVLMTSSYNHRTMLLGISDRVETLEDTAFLTDRATVTAAQMGENSHVQVHTHGVRTIQADGDVKDWAPESGTVVAAVANQRQLLVGLSTNELAFFFMDAGGSLNGLEDYPNMSGRITAIGIGAVPKGRLQSKYAVVGCDDRTIRVLSTDLETPLEPRSVQALSDVPTSIQIVDMSDPSSESAVTTVHIGLRSGLYLRAIIDDATGELSDVRSKFLGEKPVKIFPVEIEGQQCVLCCSSRPWVGFHHPTNKQFTMTPIITTATLLAASPFVSEYIGGICGIFEAETHENELRIFAPPKLGSRFVDNDIQLEYTPKNFVRNPSTSVYYVVEGEPNTYSKATVNTILQDKTDEEKAMPQLGHAKGPNHWASCIQAIAPNPITSDAGSVSHGVTSTIYLDDNEVALCCACLKFEVRGEEPYLVVGTAQDMSANGEPVAGGRGGGFLHVYQLHDNGTRMEFLHKTRFSDPVRAILPFQGRLAVGLGAELFIYDIGNTAMLRKARGGKVPNTIVTLATMGDRIVCGDVSESLTYVMYKRDANRMIPFVDDTVKRWTTCSAIMDYDTSVGGDKFGNLWVVRVPPQASAEADEEGMNGFIVNERPYLGGAPYRLECRAHTYVNDVPTALKQTPLVEGGAEVIFWAGISGTMGILVPFVGREDVVFFQTLEAALRTEAPPLTGRDHLMYRSYYQPVKGVIDGDLCEGYMALGYDSKARIAAELDKEIKEVEKKVVEMRTRVAF